VVAAAVVVPAVVAAAVMSQPVVSGADKRLLAQGRSTMAPVQAVTLRARP
jgi:hypothetical protein